MAIDTESFYVKQHGWSLTRYATDRGHLHILKWLQKNKADIHELDEVCHSFNRFSRNI